jgi:hypothetical protein
LALQWLNREERAREFHEGRHGNSPPIRSKGNTLKKKQPDDDMKRLVKPFKRFFGSAYIAVIWQCAILSYDYLVNLMILCLPYGGKAKNIFLLLLHFFTVMA